MMLVLLLVIEKTKNKEKPMYLLKELVTELDWLLLFLSDTSDMIL